MWVFGDEEFQSIVDNNWFGVVELPNRINTFGHFSQPGLAAKIYQKFLPITAANLDEFERHVAHIDSVLNGERKYLFMTHLRDNPIFALSEFPRLMFIVRDIYARGAFHMPCSYWNGVSVNSHPGNHLSFALQMLYQPVRTLMTVPNHLMESFAALPHTCITRFQTLDDMEVFGDYLAWIQDGEIEFPAITVRHGEWQEVDITGFIKWPDISLTPAWAMEQWWWDWLPEVVAQPSAIHDRVRVKIEFPSTDAMLANLVGFLLNSDRQAEDDKFAIIDGGRTTSYDDLLTLYPRSGEIRFFGNKHTQCEKIG